MCRFFILFQSNLRKQIRNLPKILKSDSVKIIHYYSISFIRVLNLRIRAARLLSGLAVPWARCRTCPPPWFQREGLMAKWGLAKIFSNLIKNLVIFARFQLHRHRISQVNTRFSTFFRSTRVSS